MALTDTETPLKQGVSGDLVFGTKGTGAAGDPKIFKKVLVDIDGNPLDVVEDDASAGKRGLVMYAKRQDTPANTSGTDGDLEVPSMTGGRLHVLDKNSDAALTALQLLDDVVHDDAGAFTKGVVVMGQSGGSAYPLAADSNGSLAVAQASDAMAVAGVAVTPKFAVIDVASSGDNTVLAAVASKKIRVLALMLVASGTVNVRFESGAGGTALTGIMPLVANSGFVLPHNPLGWFETASNTLLNLELGGAVSVDGCLTYIEV
jgi:hypothetical protein